MPHFFRNGLLLLVSGAAFGAARGHITPSHGHDVWDAPAGFPGGYVYSMTQTDDGYIWIGTGKGLVRYDGLTFASMPENNSSTETKFPVLSLLADSNDQLWATDDHTHLFTYAAGRLDGPLPDNGSHRYLTALLSRTRDGWPLFASELQGLVEYVRGSARTVLDPGRMPSLITAVAQTEDGAIWIGTRESGMFHVSFTQGGSEIQHFTPLTNVKVNCLLPIGDSALLIGTDKGLLDLHSGSLTEAVPEFGNREILALANSREGDVWIGTDGRVFKAHASNVGHQGAGRMRVLDELDVRGTVAALFEDRDGDLWIGGPDVIERYRASGFTTYLSSAGLPCINCGAIYVDHQDHVWFAPLDGGLFRLMEGSIQPIEGAGLRNDTVYSIAGGEEGEVWITRKYGGVTRFHLRSKALGATTYTRRDGLAENSVYSVYRAADNSIWFGTLTAGVSRFRGETWHTFTTHDGLPSNTISAITGNAAGEIFAGTPSGLGVFKNNHWIAYTTADGLPPGAILSLFFDDSETLWIGTKKGISFLRSGTVHAPLGAPNELYGEILGIAASNGWLWITTRDHVLRVRCNALLKQAFEAGDYREFGLTDDLPSTEGVKRSRSVVKDDRGRLWFSLKKGISVLQPSALVKPASPVTIRLDGMLVDGRLVTSDSVVHIPPGRHRLGFRYVGVNVSNPNGVRYRYRLDHVDPAWSEPTALREVDYTNIPPGQFRFHVTAQNLDGIWSGQEMTIAFELEPAYWQTQWFRVGGILAVLLLVFSLYRLRLRELHRQFNARVNERTRIARELHDTLLQSLHGLMFEFQAARNMFHKRPEEALQTLDGAIMGTEQAIAESQDAIENLRSARTADDDLAELVKAAGEDLAASRSAEHDAPTFGLTVEGQQRALTPVIREEFYRIAREVLRNAFRHAQARRIEAEILYDDHQFRLRIRDDGRGMERQIVEKGGRAGHWGLPGIRERAQQMGAKLDLWTEAGAGTEVQLAVAASIAYEKTPARARFRVFRRMGNHERRS